jgi:hypothetical protein
MNNRINKNKNGKIINLGDTIYKRPKRTYTDKINEDKDEIIDKLEDYVEVNDIGKVKLGTHIRYFKIENNVKKLILGGNLIGINGLPNYVLLSNGKFKWSVQMETVVQFYRKMTIEEIKDDYENLLEKYENKIDNLKKYIKEQQKEIMNLKYKLKN